MNNKGSTIVEAALVFPIILLSLMTLISILMFLFEDSAAQADLHTVIRREAGKETGTFISHSGSSRVVVYDGIRGIYRVMNGSSSATFEGGGILSRSFQKPVTGYLYMTDERKYARYIDFFGSRI